MSTSPHAFFVRANPHGNVRLNFRGPAGNDLAAFAAGYHEAGRRLAQDLANSNGYPDYAWYPVLFLYRHALELYMKAILYRGARYAGLFDERAPLPERFFRSHDLAKLFGALRAVFREARWSGEPELPNLKTWEDVQGLLSAIHEIDPGSYTFRYPVNRHGDAPVPRHLVLNVLAFAENMDPLLDLLAGAASGLEDLWDGAAEACFFLQEVAKEWRDEP